MNDRTVHIRTFGCQMNKLDSALIEASLHSEGFELVNSVNEADVVLLNTCSVREHAEQRVLSHLGHLKHVKESRPNLVVGVIGCMAQRLGSELFKQPAVDIVCGPAQIAEIPRLIDEAMKQKRCSSPVARRSIKLCKTHDAIRNTQYGPSLERLETEYGVDSGGIPGQAYVRAMRGCDKFCSYCVVPYVRGPEVSRPPAAIIEQTKRLAQNGVKQVTLLGQRINAYEYKAGDQTYCLADLLGMVNDVDGIEWIRFVTSYPSRKYFAEVMQAIASLPKVCRYLHLPAQSGSDKILKAMNRGYTSAEYLELLDMARQIVPDIAVAGDFIVGFPGETDDDFAQTVDLVRKANYKNCFVFKYSPRPGTAADKRLEDTIIPEVKKQRNFELLKIQEEISEKIANEFLGQTVKILVEGPSKKSHQAAEQKTEDGGQRTEDSYPSSVIRHPSSEICSQLVGRTSGDWIVVFNGPESLAGQFAITRITKTSPLTLFGTLD